MLLRTVREKMREGILVTVLIFTSNPVGEHFADGRWRVFSPPMSSLVLLIILLNNVSSVNNLTRQVRLLWLGL